MRVLSCLFVLSLLSYAPLGNCKEITFKLQLYTFKSDQLKVTPIKPPFNLFVDLVTRFGNFYLDTYEMDAEELREYMQQDKYKIQSKLKGVDFEQASRFYVIKRDIYKNYHLSEDEFIKFAADRINAEAKSFEEKVMLLSSISADMSDNYDRDRTKGKGPTEISVTDLAEGLDNRYRGNYNSRIGVCRDSHQAVLKIARQAGIKEAFGLSYISMGAPHLNLIFTDPNNPKKVISINYNELNYNEDGWENSLLVQNHLSPSTGLGFYLWNDKDKVEMYIPSDKGVLLFRGSDGDLEELDLALPENYQQISAEMKNKIGKLILFYGAATGGDGTQVISLSQSIKRTIKSYLKSDFAQSLFYTHRNLDQYTDLSTKGYYLRNSLTFLKEFKFKDQRVETYFKTLVFAAVYHAAIDTTQSEHYPVSNFRFDFHGRVKMGLKHEAFFSDSILTSKLELSLLPQTANIRNFSQYNIVEPGFDIMYSGLFFKQKYEFNINDSLKGEVGHKLRFYPIDDMPIFIGNFYASLKYKDTLNIKSSLVKCFTSFCAPWMPGSQGRIDNNVSYTFYERFNLGVTGTLYEDGNYFFGMNFSFAKF